MLRKTIKYMMSTIPILVLLAMFCAIPVHAEDVASNAEAIEGVQTNLNIVWTTVAAFLVFFMQAGFAMVETGFTRAKNAVNIIMKNLMDFSIGTIAFFLIGVLTYFEQ